MAGAPFTVPSLSLHSRFLKRRRGVERAASIFIPGVRSARRTGCGVVRQFELLSSRRTLLAQQSPCAGALPPLPTSETDSQELALASDRGGGFLGGQRAHGASQVYGRIYSPRRIFCKTVLCLFHVKRNQVLIKPFLQEWGGVQSKNEENQVLIRPFSRKLPLFAIIIKQINDLSDPPPSAGARQAGPCVSPESQHIIELHAPLLPWAAKAESGEGASHVGTGGVRGTCPP